MANVYEFSFEEYLQWHNDIMKKVDKKAYKISEPADKSTTVEEFMNSHNMIPLDKFLKDMNMKYGI